jgi:hypothetical protein
MTVMLVVHAVVVVDGVVAVSGGGSGWCCSVELWKWLWVVAVGGGGSGWCCSVELWEWLWVVLFCGVVGMVVGCGGKRRR